MALLTIAVKLIYPFDGAVRHPHNTTEPAALAVNWDAWSSIRTDSIQSASTAKRSHEEFLEVTEADVLGMQGTDMDRYLDWFGRTWAAEETRETGADAEFRRAMWKTFPVRSGDDQSRIDNPDQTEAGRRLAVQLDRVRRSQAMLSVPMVVPEREGEGREEVLRAGSRYKHYRRVEDVPGRAMTFLNEASELVGIKLEVFLLALFQVERKLEKWSAKERKSMAHAEGSEMDVDD